MLADSAECEQLRRFFRMTTNPCHRGDLLFPRTVRTVRTVENDKML